MTLSSSPQTIVSQNNIKYSLQNIENYKDSIVNTTQQIIEKYTMLIVEYLKFIIENTTIKNKSYFKFILLRGTETITHVFKTLLYYTKNLDVSYYNSQKALYFYVEFICQIFDSQHSYLKLSSRDAVMYVYKKTLFDLHNEKKKTMIGLNEEDKEKHDILITYNKLYKNMIFHILNYNEFLQQNNKEIIQSILSDFEKVCDKFNSHCCNDINKINIVYDFTQILNNANSENPSINISNYLTILLLFSKKISKKTISKAKLFEKNDELFSFSDKTSWESHIDWLFS